MKGIHTKRTKPHFGLHLTFDGYQCDPGVLGSRPAVERFLKRIVRQLAMRRLFGPKVVRAKETGGKDPGGYSGFVIIQESHISVHTFPKRRFVSIDVYSCKDFNSGRAISFIQKFFRTHTHETSLIIRGKRYPAGNLL